MKLYTFSIYVADRPGVLNRVASLFRRRGFNIHSLAVGHSERPGISRMTAVVETDAGGARRVEAHLYKLVDVVQVDDITGSAAEDRAGRPWFDATRAREQQHPIEEVGARLRAMMPFLKPVAAPAATEAV